MLFRSDDTKNTKQEFKIILNELSKYMKNHFQDEERYMQSIKYPALKEHKQFHQDLIDKLTATIKSSSKLSILKIKIRIIAKRILIEHIVSEDIKIKLFEMSKINNNLIYDIKDDEDETYSFDISDIKPDH